MSEPLGPLKGNTSETLAGSDCVWAAYAVARKAQTWQTLSAVSFFQPSLVSALLHFSHVCSIRSGASDAFTKLWSYLWNFHPNLLTPLVPLPFYPDLVSLCADHNNGSFWGEPAFRFKCSRVTVVLDKNVGNLLAHDCWSQVFKSQDLLLLYMQQLQQQQLLAR